jgi:hypothetical protein
LVLTGFFLGAADAAGGAPAARAGAVMARTYHPNVRPGDPPNGRWAAAGRRANLPSVPD